MKAAKMTVRPEFALMQQGDVQSIYYMQLPRWLFSDPRYADLSLDAKVTYTFLLNRFQLSRRKGWMNERGEVFVIFPRAALAGELRICERRVTAAFRALVACELVWEKRCGLGAANQIYLAKVEPQDDPHYECAPFLTEKGDSATAESAVLDEAYSDETVPETVDTATEYLDQTANAPNHAALEPPDRRLSSRHFDASVAAESTAPEVPNRRSSKKEYRKIKENHTEISQPVSDGQQDESELSKILERCALSDFRPDAAAVFENAIERLYFTESYHIGDAVLPRSRVRARLRLLDDAVLREVERKLKGNTESRIRNSTAYVMVTIFNAIAEIKSDSMLDPKQNAIEALFSAY